MLSSMLAVTVWGGTQITTLRIAIAVGLELALLAYLAWAFRQIGRQAVLGAGSAAPTISATGLARRASAMTGRHHRVSQRS